MRGLGFQGSGQNYRRELGAQWQAINVQRSQWRVGSDDPIRFYVNVGVDFPQTQFERFVQPAATIAKFIATKADLTLRIDELFPQENFGWFVVEGIDEKKLEEFCAKFERLLIQLEPLLTTMATPEGLAEVLRSMPWQVTSGARAFMGKELAPPQWDPAERDAGLWTKDEKGRWWRQSEAV